MQLRNKKDDSVIVQRSEDDVVAGNIFLVASVYLIPIIHYKACGCMSLYAKYNIRLIKAFSDFGKREVHIFIKHFINITLYSHLEKCV